jgi:hypothetical protein
MEKLPTAEELILKRVETRSKWVEELMIEFAKLHVEAALKAASKNAKIKSRKITYSVSSGVEYDYITSIDKQTILTAYPETNIK